MKNKISDLRNHMFAALERLSDSETTEEQLKMEIERAKAVSEVGKVIVDSAKTEVMYHKISGKKQDAISSGFIDEVDAEKFNEQKKIERPPAEYNNKGHQHILDKYAKEEQ